MTDTRELDEIVIETQSDLHRLWTLLIRPLGFHETSLWLTFIGPDRRPVRSLAEITDCADLPTTEEVDQLFVMLARILEDGDEGTCVAFLITRPGSRGLLDDDRALGRLLLEGSRRSGVPIEPLHVADDTAVLALTPDDLTPDDLAPDDLAA